MKSVTVTYLRNHHAQVFDWISRGKPVEITRYGKPFALLTASGPQRRTTPPLPDIMQRLKRSFSRTYSSQDIAKGIQLSRGDYS